MSAGPTEEEIEAALQSLSSEHGARDVRNIEWWRKNGQYVRPRLRAVLEDGKEDVMADDWAVRILGDIGDPADVPLLSNVLLTFDYETTRMGAARALGKHPAPEALDALIAATKAANEDTAAYATTGLGERTDDADKARPPLEELLNHAKEEVRYRAVNALAKIGGGNEALTKRRKIEKSADVRQAIDKALKAK
jgi:HEAT repeat protein